MTTKRPYQIEPSDRTDQFYVRIVKPDLIEYLGLVRRHPEVPEKDISPYIAIYGMTAGIGWYETVGEAAEAIYQRHLEHFKSE